MTVTNLRAVKLQRALAHCAVTLICQTDKVENLPDDVRAAFPRVIPLRVGSQLTPPCVPEFGEAALELRGVSFRGRRVDLRIPYEAMLSAEEFHDPNGGGGGTRIRAAK